MTFLDGTKVRIIKGEHVGDTGTVVSMIPMYLKKETPTYRVRIDGFPIKGGWNGIVYKKDNEIEKIQKNGARKNPGISVAFLKTGVWPIEYKKWFASKFPSLVDARSTALTLSRRLDLSHFIKINDGKDGDNFPDNPSDHLAVVGWLQRLQKKYKNAMANPIKKKSVKRKRPPSVRVASAKRRRNTTSLSASELEHRIDALEKTYLVATDKEEKKFILKKIEELGDKLEKVYALNEKAFKSNPRKRRTKRNPQYSLTATPDSRVRSMSHEFKVPTKTLANLAMRGYVQEQGGGNPNAYTYKLTKLGLARWRVEAKPKIAAKKATVKAFTAGSATRKFKRTLPGPKNMYEVSVQRNPAKRKTRKRKNGPKEDYVLAGRIGKQIELLKKKPETAAREAQIKKLQAYLAKIFERAETARQKEVSEMWAAPRSFSTKKRVGGGVRKKKANPGESFRRLYREAVLAFAIPKNPEPVLTKQVIDYGIRAGATIPAIKRIIAKKKGRATANRIVNARVLQLQQSGEYSGMKVLSNPRKRRNGAFSRSDAADLIADIINRSDDHSAKYWSKGPAIRLYLKFNTNAKKGWIDNGYIDFNKDGTVAVKVDRSGSLVRDAVSDFLSQNSIMAENPFSEAEILRKQKEWDRVDEEYKTEFYKSPKDEVRLRQLAERLLEIAKGTRLERVALGKLRRHSNPRKRKPTVKARKNSVKSTIKKVVKSVKKVFKKRNDGSADREEFAGKTTGFKELYFPPGTPQGLSTLGPLVHIETDKANIKPAKGMAVLCQDSNHNLYVGSMTPDAAAYTGTESLRNKNLGKVQRIEYRCSKPHLGEQYRGNITWYHDFEAPLPTLKTDADGRFIFSGGSYTIKREGITG